MTAKDVANDLHTALENEDWVALRAVLTDDARCNLPGENAISGAAEGADAVVARARLIASYGMRFELQYILVSRSDMALSQHNTAQRDGRQFDQHVATVMPPAA